MLSTATYPALASSPAAWSPGIIQNYLRQKIGLKQAGYRDTITVRPPNATEIAFFKLPDDGRVALFEVRRTAFDDYGKPFRLTISVYPTDRNWFAVEVGEIPGKKPPGPEPHHSGRNHA